MQRSCNHGTHLDVNRVVFSLDEHGGWILLRDERCCRRAVGGVDRCFDNALPWVHHDCEIGSAWQVVGSVDARIRPIRPRHSEVAREMRASTESHEANLRLGVERPSLPVGFDTIEGTIKTQ